MASGINVKNIKYSNETSLLYLLAGGKALSRKDIAKMLSLTPAAVTKISKRLIDDGRIRESGYADERSDHAGRKEVMLTLNCDDKLVFGINAEVDNITYSVADLNGKLYLKKTMPFLSNSDEMIATAKSIFNSFVEKDKIIGAGVCIIGTLDKDDFGIWKDKLLPDKLEKALGVPVVIENNVKAFALSELMFGNHNDNKSILFLKWGTGIGSAVITDGKVFSGDDSSVAEIGHYIVDPCGKKCRCGRYGCLETVASLNSILEEAGNNLTVNELICSKDERIIRIIDEKIDLISLALTNTATILNSSRILLFGSMFNNPVIAEKMAKQCERYNSRLKKEYIGLSSFNQASSYIGAVAICAKTLFFEPRLK